MQNFNDLLKIFIAIPPGSGSTMIYDSIRSEPRFVEPKSLNRKNESSKIAVMIDQDCLPEPDLYDPRQRHFYNSNKSKTLIRAGRLYGIYLASLSEESRNFEKYLAILEERTTWNEDSIFVEKSPSGPIWAAELHQYLEQQDSNYKFILGLRNPISFIDKSLRSSIAQFFPELSRKDLIQMFVDNWVNIAKLQCRNRETIGDKSIFFTYEEVLSDTNRVQRELSKFVGRKLTIPAISNNNDKTFAALKGDQIVLEKIEKLIEENYELLDEFDYLNQAKSFVLEEKRNA